MPNIASMVLEQYTACPRLRVLDPLRWLVKQGGWDLQQCCTPDHEGGLKVAVDFGQADVGIFQRHFNISGYREMLEEYRQRRIPVIFEIDDDFFNLPRHHPQYEIISWLKPNVMDIIELADVVTTTTEVLRDVYAPHARRVEIIRNTVDPEIWTRECRWSDEGPTVIGYAGTTTHREDLEMIEPVLLHLLETRDVHLKLWGCWTDRLAAHPKVATSTKFEFDYHTYIRSFQQEDLDIAIAPLTDVPFNAGKSAIKWKEYAIGSVPGVFSRIPAYERVVDEGVTGHLATTPEEWEAALTGLVDDRDGRRTMGRRAREKVLNEYTVEVAGRKWGEILSEVIEAPRIDKVAPPQPEVTVIVPVFNRIDLTRACLSSLWRSRGSVPFEVTVVDNASTDRTQEFLSGFTHKINYIRNEENVGFSRANNQAARESRSEFLVLLNNDTEVEPGWLEALLDCQQNTRASVVGARLMYPDRSVQHAGVALYPADDKPHALYAGLPETHPHFERLTGHRRPFQVVTAACWLVPRSVYLDLGGLDERYINGYEDVDFCLRVREAGGQVWYEPGATITHHESKSPGRATHAAHNERLLFDRWRSTWEHDMPLYLADDGLIETAPGQLADNPVLAANLAVLEQRDPGRAAHLRERRFGAHRLRVEVVDGVTIRIHRPDGAVLLHSKRNPQREAARFAETAVASRQDGVVQVSGFAFGWHLEAALERLEPTDRLEVQVVEDLFIRLALENRDLTGLLADPRLVFVQEIDPERAQMLTGLAAYLQPVRRAS